MTRNDSTADGDLVKVASATDEAEAELIQGLLRTEGVSSVLRRTAGFDVPEFLAAGPRDVLVAQDEAEAAREVLQEVPGNDSVPSGDSTSTSRRVLAAVLIVMALVAGVVCVALVVWI